MRITSATLIGGRIWLNLVVENDNQLVELEVRATIDGTGRVTSVDGVVVDNLVEDQKEIADEIVEAIKMRKFHFLPTVDIHEHEEPTSTKKKKKKKKTKTRKRR